MNFSIRIDMSKSGMLPSGKKIMSNGLAATLLSTLIVSPGYAQEKEKGISALMDEIVVTARKREESIQDTPIAVSAFSGESLRARGIDKINGVASLTPNMTFSNFNANGGGNTASVYIRGVGQTDFVPSADPGVGLYVDGVYIARSVGAVLDLIDVERVEILRGPQGTLFGRNSVGGAVAIHSVKPQEEFEFKLKAKVGSDDRMNFMGTVNGALADNLFAKATIGSYKQDGFVENPITGLDTGDDDTVAARAALRWLVNDDLEINIAGDYSRDRENGQPDASTRNARRAVLLEPGSGAFFHNVIQGSGPAQGPILNPGGSPEFQRNRNNCDATPANLEGSPGNPDCANAGTVGLGKNTGTSPTFNEADIWGVSATIEWQLSDNLKFKSISAYRDLESDFAHDGDNSPFLLSWVRDVYRQDQFSQELQLQGTSFDDRFQWIIGGYYFEEDGVSLNPVDFALLDAESGGGFDHSSKAVFAQGTFDVTEKLHITAGIRYTKDVKDFIVEHPTQTAQVFVAPPFVTIVLVNEGTYTLEADDWTPMVNIAYDWNDELMTYFTYSEGFKSGGVQQRIAGPVGVAPTYEPEFVESYEIGFKYSSAGGNFVLNGAAFHSDYDDIQLETIDPNGGIAPQLQNSGVAEIRGAELEARWSPMESWFVEASVGYLDTEITEADATQIGGPAVGDRLPHVPEWAAAISIIKEFSLGDRGTITPRVDYSYRSEVLFSPDNDPDNAQDSYGLLNAGITWRSANDKYSLSIHATNITDKRHILYTEQSPAASTQNDVLGRPFEWFLTGEYRY